MFYTACANVLVTLFYMIPAFILKKAGKVSEEHLPTLSTLLIYICTPALEITSFLALDFSWEHLLGMLGFFAATLILQSIFMLALYLILRKKYDDGKYRVMTIGSVLGNVGFFGLPIIRALLPDNPEVACYCAMYMVSMNILIFTVGVFCITADKKYMSIRAAIINPTVMGFLAAFPCYLFGLRNILPSPLIGAIQTLGSLSTPLCMFVLGIRLASAPLKKAFTDIGAYIISLMKLLVFPIFCLAVISFFPVSYAFKASITILSGTPCASMILGLAEIHHSNRETASNCILVSTLLCIITIPLLTVIIA